MPRLPLRHWFRLGLLAVCLLLFALALPTVSAQPDRTWRCSKCNTRLGFGPTPPPISNCPKCGTRLVGARDEAGNPLPVGGGAPAPAPTPTPMPTPSPPPMSDPWPSPSPNSSSSAPARPAEPLFHANPALVFGGQVSIMLAAPAPRMANGWKWGLALLGSGAVLLGVPVLAVGTMLLGRR